MTAIALIELTVQTAFVDEVKTTLLKARPDTIAFAGCHGVDIYEDIADEGTVVLHELWDSADDHRTYMAWREETGIFAELLAGPVTRMVIRYFDEVNGERS